MTAKPSSLPLRRILLAEDDDSMRVFLVKALEKANYDVVAFENGEDAYERLKREPFTLLLTDIVMPKMDGIELARRASEIDPDLQDHVHHGLRRGRAQQRESAAQGRPRAVEALPPQGFGARGRSPSCGMRSRAKVRI